jgi:hypothetical protein
MMRGKGKFALATAAVGVLAAMVASCASLLGIEDVHTSEDGGPSGSGGAAGTTSAGTSGSPGASGSAVGGSSSGGSNGAGTAGTSGSAGASAGTAGSGPDASATGGAGGSSIEGGSDRGGAAGQLPSDAGTDRKESGAGESGSTITVHGTVIDFWRHRVPGVAVYLGGTTAATDATGQFTFTNVTPPYDIGLAVRYGLIQYGGSEDAWLYRGLTRPDPTLQVKDGIVGGSSGPNTWKFQNFPARSNDAGTVPRTIGISFGSPDGIWSETFTDPDGTDRGPTNISFEGTTMSAGTAHALLWEGPPTGQISPTRYVAYDQQSLTLDETSQKSVTFNMTADNTAAAQVTGSVNPAFAGAIQIDGYVRFDDGSPIHIVQASNAGTTFQMLMPTIPGSSITVSALIGSTPDGPFTVAHLDGLTPGQAGVQLNVPAPVSLVAPAAGATGVGPATMFQWSASPSVARVTLYCKGPLDTDGYTTFNVVTQDYKAELPNLGGATGIAWPKAKGCTWDVEIHGSYATVDAAAGATGYFDPLSWRYYGELLGPKRDNGLFSESSSWGLTTAP